MSDHDPHYLAATNVLLVREGKVLLSRRQNKGWGDGMLCIPGGHVEPGETPAQAAVRELKEELGMRIDTFFALKQDSPPEGTISVPSSRSKPTKNQLIMNLVSVAN
ncbi:MAG: NUDIX domain-containing protein [Candidatus Saccharimonadales bacterium]